MPNQARAIHEAGHAVIAIEMGFMLEYVSLGNDIGDSGVPVDGLCSYCWLEQDTTRISHARKRMMAVFAGVLAECEFSREDACSKFSQQTDDKFKLNEILGASGICNRSEADFLRRDAWEKCRQLVASKREQIIRVADALCKKRCLNGHEVNKLLLPEAI